MKIIADQNMPYVRELFADIGEVTLVDGRQLQPQQLQCADILLVRSVTEVNAALLAEAQQLGFVGSATIGKEHIDEAHLAAQGIQFTNAPGCNAIAVGEYAFICMLELAQQQGCLLTDKTVAIIGAGNTGSALAACLTAIGMTPLLCDPLLQQSGDPREFVSLDEAIAASDIISLHVPLTREGEHPTLHMFDKARLATLAKGTWLLNCCRGGVIDNQALVEVMTAGAQLSLVLDVWENEPHPLLTLVPWVTIATPHIAGYSLEGRARGSYLLYQACCQWLGLKADILLDDLLPPFPFQQLMIANSPSLHGQELDSQRRLLSLARLVYDVRDDDAMFRQVLTNVTGFDQMRKNHRHRREFSALSLASTGGCKLDWLISLGFAGVSQ
ncbi:4-phosphoerythronate dehydrogenase [Shewanella sp. NIFS-20-20]|uniref:4-phosphoerythronate dehydrogenase n=1 Tax=Shewanella sp. NIFS-20-20 TaxID=2853806 RepID=UPI001C470EFF|nr:4-phosphoerythronate dehydrogenase [Shewanella sp. NIFS-20-20]MBV7315022.1 4-phosphoerythronate dehydrogenase [Shewanella sp. NIFS-20-20]